LIDKGEKPETSAIRELYEETGYGGDAFEGRVKVVEMGGTVVSDPGNKLNSFFIPFSSLRPVSLTLILL
jgi:8-oxo-dGTP pyrophosphatase MutT (NUDIX family)